MQTVSSVINDSAETRGLPYAGSGSKQLFAYIDCIRGYAVLLVITCHLTYEFVDLPDPLHRLTVLGWFGVQLFFLASAVTLLMSWHHESARLGSARVVPFFVRRFFRIAPAYYAAAALYYWLNPPIHGFNLVQLLASMLFVNGWTPALMPTAHDAWSVVPGGWSVSVEYTFYLLFPIFATFVTSLGRSIIVLSGCVVIGCLANRIADPMLLQSYGSDEIDNFLYFWFPNQMAVFAAGGVLFFAMQKLARPESAALRRVLGRHGTILPAVSIAVFLSGAFLPMAQWLGQPSAWFPGFLFASIPLASLILFLSVAPNSPFVNRYAAAIGKISFSAYLLHFAVLRVVVRDFPSVFHTRATGVAAIAAFAATWCAAVLVISALSYCTYNGLEFPMMKAGGCLVRFCRPRLSIAR